MKRLAILVVAICVLISAPSISGQGAEAEQAQQILQQARQAAGGGKLAALQSLSVEGKSKRQVRMRRGPDEQAQVVTRESEFQLDFLMPDKFLRRETSEMMGMGGGGFITQISGFNGSALIQDMESSMEMPTPSPNMRMNMGQPDPAVMVKRLQADSARFWLAWVLAAPAGAALQLRHAGV